MDATFIKEARTENTGGYVMCDFITLTDGNLLVISDYMSGEEPLSFIER